LRKERGERGETKIKGMRYKKTNEFGERDYSQLRKVPNGEHAFAQTEKKREIKKRGGTRACRRARASIGANMAQS